MGFLIILLIVFRPETCKWFLKSFKPLIYGLVMAYLLDSLVMLFIKKLKVNRSQGILLSCMLLIGIIGISLYKVLPQIIESISNIISFIDQDNLDISHIIISIRNKVDNQFILKIMDYLFQASELIRGLVNSLLDKLYQASMSMAAKIGGATITIVTAFIANIYILLEKEDLLARCRRFIHAYYDDRRASGILTIFTKANKIFKSFLSGKLIDSFIVGLICIIAFTIARVPYPILMGSVVGFFNLIPYFGPIIGSIPVVAVSFFIDPTRALIALIIIVIIQQVDANILEPKIVGENVGVSPFWVIISVSVGGNLFGVPGMILGLPLLVLIKTIIEESIELRLIIKDKENIEKTKLRK